jgi:PPK2 family polyphosphate:nucleotide phosphotransferase
MGPMMDLSAVDPSSTDGAPGDKGATNVALDDLRDRLFDLQERLWAEGRRSLLVVLQAMDTGGKDGTIKHVFRGLNPVGARVASFKVPTEEERRHDFLWRVHKAVPAAGEVVVFNRSHYEDVLIVRVHELVPESVWRARYDRINEFERNLVDAGTTILKFWLHISPEEQKHRLESRLARPDKRWKFNPDDLAERARWPEYMAAAGEMIEKTSTPYAPWHVVPADHKWYRNWVVSSRLVDTLAAMDPRPPDPPASPGEHYVIPDVPL